VRGFRSCGWKRCETSGRGRNRGKIIRRKGGMGFSEAHTEAKNKATEPPFFPWKVKKALGRSRRAPASRSRQKSPLLGSRGRKRIRAGKELETNPRPASSTLKNKKKTARAALHQRQARRRQGRRAPVRERRSCSRLRSRRSRRCRPPRRGTRGRRRRRRRRPPVRGEQQLLGRHQRRRRRRGCPGPQALRRGHGRGRRRHLPGPLSAVWGDRGLRRAEEGGRLSGVWLCDVCRRSQRREGAGRDGESSFCFFCSFFPSSEHERGARQRGREAARGSSISCFAPFS